MQDTNNLHLFDRHYLILIFDPIFKKHLGIPYISRSGIHPISNWLTCVEQVIETAEGATLPYKYGHAQNLTWKNETQKPVPVPRLFDFNSNTNARSNKRNLLWMLYSRVYTHPHHAQMTHLSDLLSHICNIYPQKYD